MKRSVLVLLASLLLLSFAGRLVHADGMILPDALSPGYLSVRYHHVTVRIEDGHAVTHVEQEFFNPDSVPVAGHYLFPVPPEAMLTRFEVVVDGERQVPARQDADATNAVLRTAVAQQRDPSLLQYTDWESWAFDLSLPPGGSRTMSLEYEEVLAPAGGLYRYRYVLGTERYSAQPPEEVSLEVDLRSSAGLATVYSSSHPVSIVHLGPGRSQVRWQAEGVNLTQDFELFFAPAQGGFGGGLITGQRDGRDHFLFLFSPDLGPQQAGRLPKDIVFVIDRSGSMSGEKVEQARNALHFVLSQLGEADRFSIVSFNEAIWPLDTGLLPVSQNSLERAREYVDWLWAEGSTDIESALQAGLRILAQSEPRDAARLVVFLTDGLPTAGLTDDQIIVRRVADGNARVEARVHVFGVGYDVNTHLLDGLAAGNGGTVTYVQPGEDLELALTGFYDKVAHPLLTNLEIEFEGMEVNDLYPERLGDLFEGSSLLLSGRYKTTAPDGRAAVRVRGRVGSQPQEYVYRFDLSASGDRDFVPRLWATRHVGALLDQVRIAGERPDLVEEIRGLGLGYGIVTPYTTFVIAAQDQGAASLANMDLYRQAELNLATGQTTIQARVQNQAYQAAAQADLAVGSNIANYGRHSLAQVGAQQVDLSLFRTRKDLQGAVTAEWLAANVAIDRTIEFGSDEYFALAADPELRPLLQSGPNVILRQGDQVIAIQDAHAPAPAPASSQPLPDRTGVSREAGAYALTPVLEAMGELLALWARVAALPSIVTLLGLAVALLAVGVGVKNGWR